jgi:hypothetical protein
MVIAYWAIVAHQMGVTVLAVVGLTHHPSDQSKATQTESRSMQRKHQMTYYDNQNVKAGVMPKNVRLK